jgi:hypothetical protein
VAQLPDAARALYRAKDAAGVAESEAFVAMRRDGGGRGGRGEGAQRDQPAAQQPAGAGRAEQEHEQQHSGG